jgi:hypothetical protein
MTQVFASYDPDGDDRYYEQRSIVAADDSEQDPEIESPVTDRAIEAVGGDMREFIDVFQQFASRFVSVVPPRKNTRNAWKPRRYSLVANVPVMIAGQNRERAVLLLSTDMNNTVPVYVSTNGMMNLDQSFGMAPGAQYVPMEHTLQMFAWSTASGILYVSEESYNVL